MKIINVMFDTLNRRYLPSYGNKWVKAPNFQRLEKKSIRFTNCYAGSLPCMPARRELHSGRYNFLHRSWGPLEPFDDSVPELLKNAGIYTHLVTDHHHYWEDGGATYHNRYNSYDLIRGQEGDPWKGEVKELPIPDHLKNTREGYPPWRHDWINRQYQQKEEDYPIARTFHSALEFLKKNHQEDNWFLQIEEFDPHEPFVVPKKYLDMYDNEYSGPLFDWPDYRKVTEDPNVVQHCRIQYAASVSMCDFYLGKVLDFMDSHDMWQDTMLIVNTDHGFLLGEKGWWAKSVLVDPYDYNYDQPLYNEIAHIPLFIWDPRFENVNATRNALVQTIDIPATILDFFDVSLPSDMQGKSLTPVIQSDQAIRTGGLFGIHGRHVNVTDGKYIYMRGPQKRSNRPLFEYTLIPTHMWSMFTPNQLKSMTLSPPFSFTKQIPLLKIPAHYVKNCTKSDITKDRLLFDISTDPSQEHPLNDTEIENKMISLMQKLMQENHAPEEQFLRLGLKKPKKSKKRII